MSRPNDCGLRLKKAAIGSDDESSAIRLPQYQSVLLFATAHGPNTKRSSETTTMCSVNRLIANGLVNSGLSSRSGCRRAWRICRTPTQQPPAQQARRRPR